MDEPEVARFSLLNSMEKEQLVAHQHTQTHTLTHTHIFPKSLRLSPPEHKKLSNRASQGLAK